MATFDINELFKNQISVLKNYSVFAEAFAEYYMKRASELQEFILDAQDEEVTINVTEEKFISFASDIYGKTCFLAKSDLSKLTNEDSSYISIYDATGEIIEQVDFEQVTDLLSNAYAELFGLAGFYKSLVETTEYKQSDIFTKLTNQLGSIGLPSVVRSLILSIPDGCSTGNAFAQSTVSATEFIYDGYTWSDAMYEKGDIIVGVVTKISDTITAGLDAIIETVNDFKTLCQAIRDGLGLVFSNLLSLLNPAVLTDYEISKTGKDSIWSVPIATFNFTLDALLDFIARDDGSHLTDSMVIYNMAFPKTWTPSEMIIPHAKLGLSSGYTESFAHLFEDGSMCMIPLGNLRVVLIKKNTTDYKAEIFIDSCVTALDGTILYNPNLQGGSNQEFYEAFMNPLNFSALGQLNLQSSMYASYTISEGYGIDETFVGVSGYVARDMLFFAPSVAPEDYRSNRIFSKIRFKDAAFSVVPNMLKYAVYYATLMATKRWNDIKASTESITLNGQSATFGTTGIINAEDNSFYPYNVAQAPEPKYIVQTKEQLVDEATTFILRAIAAAAAIAVGTVLLKSLPKIRKKVYAKRLQADKLGRDYAANPTPENLDAYYKANKQANRWNKLASKLGLVPGAQVNPSTQDLDDVTRSVNDVIRGPN